MNQKSDPSIQRFIKAFPVSGAKLHSAQAWPHGTLVGWPSVTGVMDLYGDVIFPGAFKDALPKFLKRGFNPTDHDWRWEKLVGFPTVAEERGNKLYSEFRFHSDDESQVARLKCQERLDNNLEVGLSIGFSMQLGCWMYFESGIDLIKYAKAQKYDLRLFDVAGISAYSEACCAILTVSELWEYSLTPAPANEAAMAIGIKSLTNATGSSIAVSARDLAIAGRMRGVAMQKNVDLRAKSICGSRSLELAERDRAWSASSAMKRVKAETGAEDEPNSAFAKAFTVCAGPKDEFGSYHLPFADVVGGKMVAVPKALMAIAGSLDGARGGVDLSDADRESAKRFIEAYYAKMAKEFDDDSIEVPWAKDDTSMASDGKSAPVRPRYKGQYLGDWVEWDMCMSAIPHASYALHGQYGDALRGSGDFKDVGDGDAEDMLEAAHGEHKDLCMSVFRAIRAAKGTETPEEAADSMKRIMLSTLSVSGLGSGLQFERHADIAVSALRSIVERASEHAEIRSRETRPISASKRGALMDARDEVARLLKQLEGLIARTEPADAVKGAKLRDLKLRHLQLA